MSVRKKLLSEWVQCKRLLHQPISTGNYDISEVKSYQPAISAECSSLSTMFQLADGRTKHCQAVVAVEMIGGQGNRPWEFPTIPSLQEVRLFHCRTSIRACFDVLGFFVGVRV